MNYGTAYIQIHKTLTLDKLAGSDNWYARLTLPNGKRLVKTTKTEDLEAAKEVALRLYYEVDARIQTNCQTLPVSLQMLPNKPLHVWRKKYVRGHYRAAKVLIRRSSNGS